MSHKINRTGESKVLPNGLTATIIGYRNNKDIDIQFSDGRIAYHLAYSHFKKGDISGKNRWSVVTKNDRLGTVKTMKCGLDAKVVRYNDSKDIDVEFFDGDVVNTKWKEFILGEVHPSWADSHYGVREKFRKIYEGMTCVASNGMKMTCVEYRTQNDLDVVFEDGYRATTRLNNFLRGSVKNPNKSVYDHKGSRHVGETGINTQNNKMVILEYRAWDDITVKFADGTIVKSTYGQFKVGKIENPNQPRERRINRVGEVGIATCGLKMTVVEYAETRNITVQFEDGAVVKTAYRSFIKGHVGHPTLKTRGKGNFMGFITNPSAISSQGMYFECECQKCGQKFILTAHQMMEHSKIHEQER